MMEQPQAPPASRFRRTRFNFVEYLIERLVFGHGIMSVILVVAITAFLVKESLPFFGEVPLKGFLLGKDWDPTYEPATYGLVPLVCGSLLVTFLALAIALPLGVAGAVFISEMGPRRVAEWLKPAVELLAAVPSVVMGFIGLAVVSAWMQQGFGITKLAELLTRWFGEDNWMALKLYSWFPLPTGLCALVAALMIAYMAMPTIVSIAEDALNSVPRDFRAASTALGATRWETIRTVTVPAARRGVMAAAMLGVGRALGDTMTVLMVSGNFPNITLNPLNTVYTMTAAIAVETGETAQGSTHYHALFAVGLVLLLFSLLINVTADHILHRSEQG